MDPTSSDYNVPIGSERGFTDFLTSHIAGGSSQNTTGLMGGGAGSTGNPLLDMLIKLMPSVSQYLPMLSGMQNNPTGVMQTLNQSPQHVQSLPPQLQAQIMQLLQHYQQNPAQFSNVSMPMNQGYGQQGMGSTSGGMGGGMVGGMVGGMGGGGMGGGMGGMGTGMSMGMGGMPNKLAPNAIAPHGWPYSGQNRPSSQGNTPFYGSSAQSGSYPSNFNPAGMMPPNSTMAPPPGYPISAGAPIPPSPGFSTGGPVQNAQAPYGWPGYATNQQTPSNFTYYSNGVGF